MFRWVEGLGADVDVAYARAIGLLGVKFKLDIRDLRESTCSSLVQFNSSLPSIYTFERRILPHRVLQRIPDRLP